MEQSDSESRIGTGHFMWRANISGSLFPVSIQTKLHALHKTLPAVGVLWKCLHVEAAVLMWFYKRDCLAPRASLGVASSDICWPPFCPSSTLINYVQLFSWLFATFFRSHAEQNFFANCPWMMRQAFLWNVPFHIFPNNFGRVIWHMFTSQHAWKERLDLSWLSCGCGHEQLIFFGCQLEKWSWDQ